MTGFKILLIEDDHQAAALVCQALTLKAYQVTTVATAHAGLLRASVDPWDLLIVDRMLPGYDGLKLVQALRKVRVEVPVLFLTALDGIDDRVGGLRAGGDDYLIKPFAFAELCARVEALIRRCPAPSRRSTLSYADIWLDRRKQIVTRAGQAISLTQIEFKILEALLLNQGKVTTHKMLLEKVWDYSFDPGTSVVASHVSRLRVKIESNFSTKILYTLRGVGYRFGINAN